MKKILVFTFSDALGGSEFHILKFTRLINYKFHWVVLNRANGSIKDAILADDLNIGYSDLKYKGITDLLKIIRAFHNIVKGDNKPLIYAVGFLPSLFASLLKISLPEINLITTRREMMPWKRWYHHPFLLFVNLMSSKIETNSHYLLKKIESEWFAQSKAYYLPNIISEEVINPSSSKNPFEEIDKFKYKIGLVANIRPPKNIPLFIEISKKILPKYDDICFALVGRDSVNCEMTSLIKDNKVHKNFFYFNDIKHDEIGHFYKTIDIFLFTSLYEGNPNVISEAMINQLPIVSSRISAVAHILHHNKGAYLCDTSDMQSFLESLESLIRNPELINDFGVYNESLIKRLHNKHKIKEIVQNQFEC